jgi:hypothetical protein
MGYEDDMWGVGEDDQESYTRNQVEKRIEEEFSAFYNEIIKEIEERLEPKKNNNNYFRVHPTKSKNETKIVGELHRFLTSGGYIEDIELKKFTTIFSGEKINTNYQTIKWLKQSNLCPYLFELLVDKELISDYRIPKKIELFFLIKNPSQKMGRYKDSKIGKPNNYKPIEAIVDNIIKCL